MSMVRAAAVCLVLVATTGRGLAGQGPPAPPHPLKFIDTGFENASPVWYDLADDGTVVVHLLYDHERDAPNRAAGHFHFRLIAPEGSKLRLEFTNLENVYNGRPASTASELKLAVVSVDGRVWRPVPLEALPANRVRMTIAMPAPALYVARVEPYRLSDLDAWLASIRSNPLVTVTTIGKTVAGRPLEIVGVGRPDAPRRVFLRARAHPWEPGGNWVVEGLVRRLLQDDDEARRFLERYRVDILPMANKDGVALGRTRFNLRGKDLNRDWDRPADPELAPENAALENWLTRRIQAGQQPDLALELHNDGFGRLHVSQPTTPETGRYLEHMATFEKLLRKHTWFTEGSTSGPVTRVSTLATGWLTRFGIDAAVHEFNANRIAGLDDYPSAAHWKDYGSGLARALHEYLGETRP